MSSFWSAFIIVLVVLNLIGCVWLLWWTSKRRKGMPSGETTGHVWDEDITEYNKPLPKWWINLFYLTIVYSVGYLVWYPGLGDFAGASGWTSEREHAAAVAAAEETLAPLFARYEGRPVEDIATDPEAVKLGQSIYANNCATCHGSDARGAKGFPNLVDDSWQWGGEPETILKTILDGRVAAMPPMAPMLGSERAITEVAVYVQSLSGQKADPALVAAGRQRFTVCAACHGPEGKGNPTLGAPDLTDDAWLYGGDFESIRTSIAKGRNGHMPAHDEILGETRARLVAAWLESRKQDKGAVAGAAP